MLSLSTIDPAYEALLPFGLAIFRQALSREVCEVYEADLSDADGWQVLRFGEYHDGRLERLSEDDDVHGLVNYKFSFPVAFEKEIKSSVSEFASSTWKFRELRFSRFTASRLDAGMELGVHRDTRYADTPRVLSVVTYLSSHFDGGAITFPGLGTSITPQQGDILIFFSEHEHVVERVRSGHRCTGVFFLER